MAGFGRLVNFRNIEKAFDPKVLNISIGSRTRDYREQRFSRICVFFLEKKILIIVAYVLRRKQK